MFPGMLVPGKHIYEYPEGSKEHNWMVFWLSFEEVIVIVLRSHPFFTLVTVESPPMNSSLLYLVVAQVSRDACSWKAYLELSLGSKEHIWMVFLVVL
jgi:hypothetical protein